jgi:hypothetical protein
MANDILNAKRLYDVVLAEIELISQIIQMQKAVREATKNRDWEGLQSTFYYINELSEGFLELEERRVAYFKDFGAKTGSELHQISQNLPFQFKNPITSVFTELKKKLLESKIENDAINEYISITQEFIQGVFDEVLPQRRNTLYSKTGTLIKNQPESIILSAVL